MKLQHRPDRELLSTAKAVAERLRSNSEGTRLRIKIPTRSFSTNTDGWYASIGDLGKGEPKLQIWLDRFSGYEERKYSACFYTEDRRQITTIFKRVSKKLWPCREINLSDTTGDRHVVLATRLGRAEFNTPILEKYEKGRTFYGIYDPTREVSQTVSLYFCSRAEAFFQDVARALPHAVAEDQEREVYPQLENRKLVASHLQRERSRLLATECKIRDKHQCQVCGLRFEELYGKIGREFAEAHHRVPLSKLREGVRTRLEDLTTVCANCHRMLHRMAGKADDIIKLKAIVIKRHPNRRKSVNANTNR